MIPKPGTPERREYMRQIAAKGGRAKVPTKGFGSMSKSRLQYITRKGGRKKKADYGQL